MDIIIKQEIELHQFHIRKSEKDIERLVHKDFKEIGKSGKEFDYISTLAMLKTEESTKDEILSKNFEFIDLSTSIKLLKYESAVKNKNGDITDFARRTSIWQLNEKQWQLIYHQGTPCDKLRF